MNATSEVAETFESTFHAHYERIARVIGRITHDPARAEELAVEVFLKWSRSPAAHGSRAEGWLYRTAVRMGLDDLRRRARRERYEGMLQFLLRSAPDPEQIHAAGEERTRVRAALASIGVRDAEMLVLRSEDLSYAEIAAALGLNPASVGTLLSRAQQMFRKEYVKRYGEQ